MKAAFRLLPFTLILIALAVMFSPEFSSAAAMGSTTVSSLSEDGCAINGGSGPLWLADFSPFTSSPSIADLPDDGQCVRGRFECRWGGDCEKVGDKCYNCIADYHWSAGMNTCYHCGEGQNLVLTPSGEWRCQS